MPIAPYSIYSGGLKNGDTAAHLTHQQSTLPAVNTAVDRAWTSRCSALQVEKVVGELLIGHLHCCAEQPSTTRFFGTVTQDVPGLSRLQVVGVRRINLYGDCFDAISEIVTFLHRWEGRSPLKARLRLADTIGAVRHTDAIDAGSKEGLCL